MRTNKNNIDVNANFDSGTFMHFSVISIKNKNSYNPIDYNIQKVEKLTFDDFTALEVMIGQAVSNFLDMKHRETKELKRLADEER